LTNFTIIKKTEQGSPDTATRAMIYFHHNTSIYFTGQLQSLQNSMLGDFKISRDVIEQHVVTKLDAESLLLLSMTGKDLLKFVDSAGSSIFISAINSGGTKLQFRLPFTQKPITHEAEIVYKAIVQIQSLHEQLQTLRSFNVISGLNVAVSVRGKHDNEEYIFSNFKVLRAYMPAPPRKVNNNPTYLRQYNFKMLGTVTHKNVGTHFKEKMELLPNVKLDLDVKNVLLCQMETARQYYAFRCKSMCLSCNRSIAEFITYDKVLEKGHQKICKACRNEFFVTLKDLCTTYKMEFDQQRARHDIRGIQISYLPNRGYGSKMIKLMYKEDVAKLAGFSGWTSMVHNWPPVLKRDLKKN